MEFLEDSPENEALDGQVKPGVIRIILADSQAIYRVGIRKVFALEDDLRVVAQADSLENLRAAIERIVTQEIPQAAIDDPRLDWDPVKNILSAAPAGEVEERPGQAGKSGGVLKVSAAREPDTRYEFFC